MDDDVAGHICHAHASDTIELKKRYSHMWRMRMTWRVMSGRPCLDSRLAQADSVQHGNGRPVHRLHHVAAQIEFESKI